MQLYNTLTKRVEPFEPLEGKTVRIYSCGPTVYDHIHIGNLASFIYADTLNRALQAAGYEVQHVMNITDVDDKMIKRSQERYPEEEPKTALKKLADEYEGIFMKDMAAIGNDISTLTFVRATDKIEEMQKLITQLYKDGFAYVADDGVYFSIEKYQNSGKKYGQLTPITVGSTSEARIVNDEYDKESVHDFALWKKQKPGEPAWDFTLDGHNLSGRPGWHIECSAMSTEALGQPFDIHTGGVDLIFPHHENEIAQSTAGKGSPVFANLFFHNEHLHVEGKKMSKSLNNFYTLEDIKKKGVDPLAFRLMVLQSHYRSQSNFTWEILEAAQTRLKRFCNLAVLRHQSEGPQVSSGVYDAQTLIELPGLKEDLNIPEALRGVETYIDNMERRGGLGDDVQLIQSFIQYLDALFGLNLMNEKDTLEKQKAIINQREDARHNKDWSKSDELRDKLKDQGIGVNDTDHGPIWYRLY